MYYYSSSTGGFYTTEIHGSNMPQDVVEISVETHQQLLEGQSQGQTITSDESGNPILVAPPAPTLASQLASLDSATTAYLDDFARKRGYNSLLEVTSYSASTVTELAADATVAITTRDTTQQAKLDIFAQVKSGERTLPTVLEFVAELPVTEWPLTYQEFTLDYDTDPETLSYQGTELPKVIIEGTQDVEFDLSSLIKYDGHATNIVSINGDASGFIQVNPQVTLTYDLGTPILRVNDIQSSGPLTFTAVSVAVSCN